MVKKHLFVLVSALVASTPLAARAHISIVSGPGFANLTQEITFGVGHGCAGSDTYRVRVEIPGSVTSVRPVRSDFGKISVEKDAAGTITAVVWQKADADALDADLAYYKLVIRAKLPNTPFSSLYFPARQTCRAADGTLSVVDWSMLPAATPVDAGATDGGAQDEPAPVLVLLPARRAGWNKFTVTTAVSDLGALFGDALIVWKGTAAYSANPITVDLIKATSGVNTLAGLAPNDEIWVKY
jgi:uncharacterized protein YcnI